MKVNWNLTVNLPHFRSAVTKYADNIERYLKEIVNVRTGALRNSILITANVGANSLVIELDQLFYAKYLHPYYELSQSSVDVSWPTVAAELQAALERDLVDIIEGVAK